MSRVDEAAKLFADRNSCSQAVFVAFAPSLGMDDAEARRLASGLGGGMHIGGTCGAATGAVLALGLRYGNDDRTNDRMSVMDAVESFYARFRERVGATDCPDILGCDICSSEGRAVSRELGLRETRCLEAVRTAAQILEELLESKTHAR